MIALVLGTLFSACFSLIVRGAQRRGCNLWAVGALNYATAMLFHLVRWGIGGAGLPSMPTVTIGVLGGLAYVGSYFLLFPAMQLKGVSITTAVMRLAVVIPVAVAVLFWGERPTSAQVAGALLALASLPLLTLGPNGGPTRLSWRAIVLLAALFVGNGLCSLALRAFRQTDILGQEALFLAILFATAATVALGAWALHRAGSSARDLLPGVGLGLCNALSNIAMVIALQQLPSVVVFPFWSSVGLVFAVLFARIVWGERITRLETVGMTVGLLAVAFINLA